MYRKRKRISAKLQEAMQRGRARARMERPMEDRPPELPERRRIVLVIDYDFGKVVERMDLYKTNRRDCYKAVINGKVWKNRVGWAKALEGVRKSFVRVGR